MISFVVDARPAATAIEDIRFSIEMLMLRATEHVARKQYQLEREVPELVDLGGEA